MTFRSGYSRFFGVLGIYTALLSFFSFSTLDSGTSLVATVLPLTIIGQLLYIVTAPARHLRRLSILLAIVSVLSFPVFYIIYVVNVVGIKSNSGSEALFLSAIMYSLAVPVLGVVQLVFFEVRKKHQ